MLSPANTINKFNKIENFAKKHQKNLSFCYNLIQQQVHLLCFRWIYCHRLGIIKHASVYSQNEQNAYEVKKYALAIAMLKLFERLLFCTLNWLTVVPPGSIVWL